MIGEHDVFDDEPLRWVAYFKGGAIVQGDGDGRPGAPDQLSRYCAAPNSDCATPSW